MPYTPPVLPRFGQGQGWYHVDDKVTHRRRGPFAPFVGVPQSEEPSFTTMPDVDDFKAKAEAIIQSFSKPRLRVLPPANAKPLKPSLKLLRGGNQFDVEISHPLFIPFRDPLEVLPTELWISCMQFALGDHSIQGPLLYAGVSASWQAKLLETPILWKDICLVNGEDEDARVTTFLHLSQQTPLIVEILAPIHDLTPLSKVLGQGVRIESLSFNPYHQWSNRQKSVLDAWSTSLHSIFSLIMRPGIKYSTLKRIDGTGILTISQAMTIIWACPNAKFVSSEGGDKRLPTVPSPFKSKLRLEHAIGRILLNTSLRERKVLLTGPPDSGKTSMAAYFMQRYRNSFSFILFIDASSEQNIQAGLISAAEQLGLSTSSKWNEVLYALSQKENSLVVYDNVLGPELLEKYLPSCSHSAILVTTKDLSKEERLGYPRFSTFQVGPKLVQFAAGDKLENILVFENTEHQDAANSHTEDDEKEGYVLSGSPDSDSFPDSYTFPSPRKDSSSNKMLPGVRFRSSSDLIDDSLPPLKSTRSFLHGLNDRQSAPSPNHVSDRFVTSTASFVTSASSFLANPSDPPSPTLSPNSDMSTSTSLPVSTTFGGLLGSWSSVHPLPSTNDIPRNGFQVMDNSYAEFIQKYCFYQVPR